jgi:hypothetical protein
MPRTRRPQVNEACVHCGVALVPGKTAYVGAGGVLYCKRRSRERYLASPRAIEASERRESRPEPETWRPPWERAEPGALLVEADGLFVPVVALVASARRFEDRLEALRAAERLLYDVESGLRGGER